MTSRWWECNEHLGYAHYKNMQFYKLEVPQPVLDTIPVAHSFQVKAELLRHGWNAKVMFKFYCIHYIAGSLSLMTIHQSPVDFLQKYQWRVLMFYLICAWTNGWANKRRRWFDTSSRPLWRHCSEACFSIMLMYAHIAFINRWLKRQIESALKFNPCQFCLEDRSILNHC